MLLLVDAMKQEPLVYLTTKTVVAIIQSNLFRLDS